MKQICHVGKRALAVVLAFYMMLGPVGNTVSATELPSGGEGGGSLCACPAEEGGQPVHQPGCPLYKEPEEPAEPQEEPEAPACTCGAQPDENGVTSHAPDCPLCEEPEESEEPPRDWLEEMTLPLSLSGSDSGSPPQAVMLRVRATVRARQRKVRREEGFFMEGSPRKIFVWDNG